MWLEEEIQENEFLDEPTDSQSLYSAKGGILWLLPEGVVWHHEAESAAYRFWGL